MTDVETVRGTLEQHYAAAGASAVGTRDAIEALSRIEQRHGAVVAALREFVDGQWIDEYGRIKNRRAFVEAKRKGSAALEAE